MPYSKPENTYVVRFRKKPETYATLLGMLWIGIVCLPFDGLLEDPTTAPLSGR